MGREYPEQPVVAVGVVLLDGEPGSERVLLVRRGRPPNAGLWTVPGGKVEVGESMRDAAARELLEETGISARIGPIVEVLERIVAGEAGRAKYHYVIIDYLGTEPRGVLAAGDDASEARFVALSDLSSYATTDNLAPVIERARQILRGEIIGSGESPPPIEPASPLRK